ncbi:LppA family lipoprotein [Saccharopolyspora griseoalba]|uniref:LppA family lipoprotein n=1 Tax=Saccharopolyspora griseoalba TaxID=1431848 RepID=A0ABW2LLR2_9PSEU
MLDPRGALRQRPSIEDVSARYRQMQRRLRDLLDEAVGPLGWTVIEPELAQPCSTFPAIDEAQSRVLERWRAPRTISDDDWPRAARVVEAVTGEFEFTAPEVVVNRTGDHEITGNDTYGAVYSFGTATGTELGITTGCHLPSVMRD